MIKFFAKFYEEICTLLAIIVLLVFIAAGAYFGHYLGDYLDMTPSTCAVILGLVGFIVGLLLDFFTFGFIAQIIEIKKHLERLDK